MKDKKTPSIKLYEVREDVKCLKCGCKGAVKSYGTYYPIGLGNRIDELKENTRIFQEPYRNKPKMSKAVGFGGTVPYKCLNCGNTGLIDIGGLELLEKAFESFK